MHGTLCRRERVEDSSNVVEPFLYCTEIRTEEIRHMSESPTLIIFGASGDLTERKLIPSLYRLFCKKRLPHGLKVVGVSRSPMSHDEFRQKSEQMSTHWIGLEENGLRGNYRFSLSVGPYLYEAIVNNLAGQGLNDQSENWRRLIIEKPFGRDLQSAQALNTVVRSHFAEEQIYRIDHYLGKETVQNILALRFANIMYEPIWNHNYIEHVQITVAESVSVQGRGDYYEKAGVLRDMFQNKLLQLLCLVAMEAPARYSADTLRNEKVKVLDAIEQP